MLTRSYKDRCLEFNLALGSWKDNRSRAKKKLQLKSNLPYYKDKPVERKEKNNLTNYNKLKKLQRQH
jgi:hypothetical protein